MTYRSIIFALGTALTLSATDKVQAQSATLDVQAEVVSSGCTLSGGTLNFGTYTSGQASDLDVSTTVTVDCPNNVTLTYSPGNNLNASNRAMANNAGSGETLFYQLYINTFGGLAAGGVGGFGTAQGVTGSANAQPVTVFGRVFGNQSVSPGNYSDVVQVTMTVN